MSTVPTRSKGGDLPSVVEEQTPVEVPVEPIVLNEEQKIAKEGILRYCQTFGTLRDCEPRPPCYLFGYAGTGKTMIISMILCELAERGYPICLTAPTHKAVGVLQSGICSRQPELEAQYEFATLHSALAILPRLDLATGEMSFQLSLHDTRHLPHEAVVVDEASMLNKELVGILGEVAGPHFIYLGDRAQLPPVGEKESLIFSQAEGSPWLFQLTEIMRTGSQAIKDISMAVRECYPWNIRLLSRQIMAIKEEDQTGSVYVYRTRRKEHTRSKWYRETLRMLREGEEEPPIVLAWRNKTVDWYNAVVRQGLHPEIDPEELKHNPYLPGDLVLFDSYYYPQLAYPSQKPVKLGDTLTVVSVEKERRNLCDWSQFSLEEEGGKKGNSRTREYLQHTLTRLSAITMTFQTYALVLRNSKGVCYRAHIVAYSNLEKYAKSCARVDRIIGRFYSETEASRITKALWDYYHLHTKKEMAQLSCGHSITVHKAQGSTYQNVMVDLNDICVNPLVDELRSELYTAVTRASRRLYVLCE